MADKSFDNFVRREQQAVKVSDQNPVDWQAEKTAWLRHLEELFTQVEGYLKPYVDAGQVVIRYRSINLNEEYIGLYSTKEMIITIGSKTIKLEPIGTLIVGSKGRVEVAGPRARAQLLLLDSKVRSTSQLIHVSVSINGGLPSPPPRKPPSNIKWVWRIVTRPPQREIIEINKDNFLNLLVEISNGQNI
ncbi:MAG: hypothetical protein ABSA59_10240 [Terriglobia bacterium]|jgi:hypothetical protein